MRGSRLRYWLHLLRCERPSWESRLRSLYTSDRLSFQGGHPSKETLAGEGLPQPPNEALTSLKTRAHRGSLRSGQRKRWFIYPIPAKEWDVWEGLMGAD